jgi:hypothetical protein
MDADDAATITATGADVTAWYDKSASGQDFTVTGANKPQTGTRTQNARNVLDFGVTGSTTPISTAANQIVSQPLTVFYVAITDVPTVVGKNRILCNRYGLAFQVVHSDGSVGSRTALGYAGVSFVKSAADSVSTAVWGVGTIEFNGGTSLAYINGVAGTPSYPGEQGLNIGKIGARGDDGTPLDGAIAEIVVYDSVLSTTDRESVEDYLTTKWAI